MAKNLKKDRQLVAGLQNHEIDVFVGKYEGVSRKIVREIVKRVGSSRDAVELELGKNYTLKPDNYDRSRY